MPETRGDPDAAVVPSWPSPAIAAIVALDGGTPIESAAHHVPPTDAQADRIRALEARIATSEGARSKLAARCSRQRIIMAELAHRLANTLALTQAMVVQTLRNTVTIEQAREALIARIISLARAHEALAKGNRSSVCVRRTVRTALAAHGLSEGSARFSVGGPSVRIDAGRTESLFIILNELATNATKYGALSSDGGHVALEWRTSRRAGIRWLHLVWRERGGPSPSLGKGGTGLRLIRRMMTGVYGEGARLRFDPEGVTCEVDIRIHPRGAGIPVSAGNGEPRRRI